MNKLRSPICYFGGKGLMVNKLLELMPPHHTYVEVFGGGASLLFAKTPSPVEVYNDIDSDLVNLFRVLRDREKFDRFYHLAALTPYSREEYYFCRDTYEQVEDEVERAYRFFVAARMGFSGRIKEGSWGMKVTQSTRHMAASCSAWLGTIEMLPQIAERLLRVQIEHYDFRNIFKIYDTPETLFYCDPPYLPETRRAGGYRFEMTREDHEELVEILLNIKGKVMLSGYKNDVYARLEEAGWHRVDYHTACHTVARTRASGILGKGAALRLQPRVESVWLNPQAQRKGTLL